MSFEAAFFQFCEFFGATETVWGFLKNIIL